MVRKHCREKTIAQDRQAAEDMKRMSLDEKLIFLAKVSKKQADVQQQVMRPDSQRAVVSDVAAPAHGVEAIGLATPANGPQGSGGSVKEEVSAAAKRLQAEKAAKQAEKDEQRARSRKNAQELDFYF